MVCATCGKSFSWEHFREHDCQEIFEPDADKLRAELTQERAIMDQLRGQLALLEYDAERLEKNNALLRSYIAKLLNEREEMRAEVVKLRERR